MGRRLFVVGLDGVGFDLLTPWVEEGRLPHLSVLLEQGAKGPLRSTIPPLTGPAWASLQTGVNPGKHGVFGWTRRRCGTYTFSVINADDIGYPTLFELVSEAGRRVVSIGVPLTYPPRPVNGVIIPGMPTPPSDPSPTYPPEAYAELRRVSPHYRFFPECAHRYGLQAKVAELRASTRATAQAARHFMAKEDWDLFFVHFQATDKAQHDLWGVKRGGGDPVLAVFQEVDHLVGDLVETAFRMGASVVLLSDHGMGPQDYTFSINTWLWQAGYLTLKGGLSSRFRRAAFRSGLTQRRLSRLGLLFYPLAYRLRLATSFLDVVGEGRLAKAIASLFLSLGDVDWSKTRAYSHADIGHLSLNLAGREPQGIVTEEESGALVDELIGRLEAVVNPSTGEPLLGEVFRREEVYRGERLGEAPDIVFLPRDLRTIACGASGFYSNAMFTRSVPRASHRMEGIVVALGEPFRPRYEIEGASLLDLGPNLLYLLGCPIPTDMDGRIWEDAFCAGTLEEHPPRFRELGEWSRGEVRPREKDDAELVRHLKGLGYLS